MPRTHAPESVKATARRLRREGLSHRQIAERIGVARATAQVWVAGVERGEFVKRCWCGAEFVARRSDALSCSEACKTKRWQVFGPVRNVRAKA